MKLKVTETIKAMYALELAAFALLFSQPALGQALPADCVSISTVADLNKVAGDKRYCLANDIELSANNQPQQLTLNGGEFDGRGHTIRGFIFSERGGLFNIISKAKIANVVFDAVTVKMAPTNANIGLVVNSAFNTQFENIKIQNLNFVTPIAANSCGLLAGSVQDRGRIQGITIKSPKIDSSCQRFASVAAHLSFQDSAEFLVKDIFVTTEIRDLAEKPGRDSSGIFGAIIMGRQDSFLRISLENVHFTGNIKANSAAGLIGHTQNQNSGELRLSITDSSFDGVLEGERAGGFIRHGSLDVLYVANSYSRARMQSKLSSTYATYGGLAGILQGYGYWGINGAIIVNSAFITELAVGAPTGANISAGGMIGTLVGTAAADKSYIKARLLVAGGSVVKLGGAVGQSGEFEDGNFAINNSAIDAIIQAADTNITDLGGIVGISLSPYLSKSNNNFQREVLQAVRTTVGLTNLSGHYGYASSTGFVAYPANLMPVKTADKTLTLVVGEAPQF